MSRSVKTLKNRGSRTGGFSRNSKTGAGNRGGTGKAGSLTHKYLHYLLQRRNKNKNRKVINLDLLESKQDYFLKKRFLKYVSEDPETKIKTYKITSLFCSKYKKILSNGELSFKLLDTKNIKFSKQTLKKIK